MCVRKEEKVLTEPRISISTSTRDAAANIYFLMDFLLKVSLPEPVGVSFKLLVT